MKKIIDKNNKEKKKILVKIILITNDNYGKKSSSLKLDKLLTE